MTWKAADTHAAFFRFWLKERKFCGQQPIPSLPDSEWATFRRDMRFTCAEIALLLERPLIGKTEQATREDLHCKALIEALIGAWSGEKGLGESGG